MEARVDVACKYAAIAAVTATMIHEGDERGRSIGGSALCVAEADQRRSDNPTVEGARG